MKKTVSMILVIAILMLTTASFAEDVQPGDHFVFRNGVTWGMSLEEVKAIEGEPSWTPNTMDSLVASTYADVKVSRTTADLNYVFDADRLFFCFYTITGTEEMEYLKRALAYKYGEPQEVTPYTIAAFMNTIAPGDASADIIADNVQWTTQDTMIWLFSYNGNILLFYRDTDFERSVPEAYDTFGL